MKVYERLQQTPEEYEHMIMNIWFSWCREKTSTEKSLQKVLICQPLFHWWQREMKKLETDFLNDTQGYTGIAKIEWLKLYAEYIIPVFDRFSKPLLKKAYK